jgi:hypothetical protein
MVIVLLLFLGLVATRNDRGLYHVNGFVTAALLAFTSLRTAYVMVESGLAVGPLIVLIGVASTMLSRLWFGITAGTIGAMYLYTVFYLFEIPDHVVESNGLYAVAALSMLLFFQGAPFTSRSSDRARCWSRMSTFFERNWKSDMRSKPI